MTFTSEAAVLREFGTPDVFAIHEIKLPWPGSADDADPDVVWPGSRTSASGRLCALRNELVSRRSYQA